MDGNCLLQPNVNDDADCYIPRLVMNPESFGGWKCLVNVSGITNFVKNCKIKLSRGEPRIVRTLQSSFSLEFFFLERGTPATWLPVACKNACDGNLQPFF